MKRDGRRRLGWVATAVAPVVAYLGLREYADHARSLEAVLGLFHGDPAWHAFVAAAVVLLRLAAYGAAGGTLLAWPLEEWLLRRRSLAAGSPGADVPPGSDPPGSAGAPEERVEGPWPDETPPTEGYR